MASTVADISRNFVSDNFTLLFHYNAAHMFMIYGHRLVGRDGKNSRGLGCS